eukprot:101887-Chlamydomonas_euryale.AAC.1
MIVGWSVRKVQGSARELGRGGLWPSVEPLPQAWGCRLVFSPSYKLRPRVLVEGVVKGTPACSVGMAGCGCWSR